MNEIHVVTKNQSLYKQRNSCEIPKFFKHKFLASYHVELAIPTWRTYCIMQHVPFKYTSYIFSENPRPFERPPWSSAEPSDVTLWHLYLWGMC